MQAMLSESFRVITTSHDTTPEEMAEIFMSRLLEVNESAPEPLKTEIQAHSKVICDLAAVYFEKMQDLAIAKKCQALREAGREDIVKVLESL